MADHDETAPAAGVSPAPTTRPDVTETVAADAPDATTAPASESPPPGTRVRYFGDYELRRELGHGGMGVVYEARQISLNRPVALKMLRAGAFATDDDLRRFQNEAEAVALLDHPHIVPIHEVGAHDGQRYFSMKRIEGQSLDRCLADYPSDPRAAARLVVEAADAVQHAHARGILHRDLKPGNILVDAQGHAHVTDFGLAKKVEAGDAEHTQSGAIVGTPAYMSPEQATGRRGAVTTASDVYGLGAVLYALLTGQAPFRGDSLVDTLQRVREQAPEPPRTINARVPRDLETICLKCLDKDPRRRYTSAQALGDDLRNWLENRPIAARRVGAVERAWLWAKRRPAVAALGVAVVCSLAGTTFFAVAWGRQQAELAQRETQAARTERALRTEAEEQARIANTWLDRAMEAFAGYHAGVSEEVLLARPELKGLRERLLEKPRAFYAMLTRELAAKPNPGIRELALLASGRGDLGKVLYELGQHDEARAQIEASLATYGDLVARAPAEPAYRFGLATGFNNLSDVLADSGRHVEAEPVLRRAIAGFEALAAAHPDVPEYRHRVALCETNLGVLLWNFGRHAEAEQALRRAIAIDVALSAEYPNSRDCRVILALACKALGDVLEETAEVGEAERAYHDAIRLYAALAAEQPEVAQHRMGLAGSETNLASLLGKRGRFREAEAEIRKAIAVYRAVVSEQPAVPEFRAGLVNASNGLAMALQLSGRKRQAEQAFHEAIDACRALVAGQPDAPRHRHVLATLQSNLGVLFNETGRTREAEQAHAEAVGLLRELVARQPAVREYRVALGRSLFNLGQVRGQMGQPAEARDTLAEAVTVLDALAAEQPGDFEALAILGVSRVYQGMATRNLGRPAEALPLFNQGVASIEEALRREPGDPDTRRRVSTAHLERAQTLELLGRDAEADWDRAQALATLLEKPRIAAARAAWRSGNAPDALILRAIRQARDGAPEAALAEVAPLRDRAGALPPGVRYNLACVLAVSAEALDRARDGDSTDRARHADALAAEAVVLLHSARAAGFFAAPQYRALLSNDADLDALRDRADFQALVLDLALPAEPFAR
jgi:tetratricopeptide (TPR) repeat protein